MIGGEVRRRREALGLTGAQLAARAGLAPSAVSQIETGKRTPSSTSVIKLAAALSVEVGDLYPKGQAPLPDFDEGGSPNLEEMLKRRGVRTRHLLDERLKDTLEELPLEDHARIVGEVCDEVLAIDADLRRLQRHDGTLFPRLFGEVTRQFFIARWSLRARRRQEFVPDLGISGIDQTEQALERAERALAGAA